VSPNTSEIPKQILGCQVHDHERPVELFDGGLSQILFGAHGPGRIRSAAVLQQTEKFVSEPCLYKCVIHVPEGASKLDYTRSWRLSHGGPSNKPGPIAGFAEGGLLQFYDGGLIPPIGIPQT
jgi:hypothetical protein